MLTLKITFKKPPQNKKEMFASRKDLKCCVLIFPFTPLNFSLDTQSMTDTLAGLSQ